MVDAELLKQADEFLNNARIEDYRAMKLVYTMRVRLEELLADKEPEPVKVTSEPKPAHVTSPLKLGDSYYFITGCNLAWEEDVWADTAVDYSRLVDNNVYVNLHAAVETILNGQDDA